jgi:hypothetical protein
MFATAVMGEQLNPMGTLRPVRSRPRRAATAEAAVLEEETTLLQHCGEVGGVIGKGLKSKSVRRGISIVRCIQ